MPHFRCIVAAATPELPEEAVDSLMQASMDLLTGDLAIDGYAYQTADVALMYRLTVDVDADDEPAAEQALLGALAERGLRPLANSTPLITQL